MRRTVMNFEKEVKKAIKKNNVQHLYNNILLKVDHMSVNLARFNADKRSHAAGKRLRIELSELEIYAGKVKKIVQILRKHRKNVKELETEKFQKL